MLTHSGQDQAKEPAFSASGLGQQEVKVVLFAFDRAFGTRAGITVALPEVTISGDQGMKPIVLLGIGVNDPSVRGSGTAVGKKRAVGQGWRLFGGG